MKPTDEDLLQLFRTNIRFVVPRFQRPYVWTKENWESLWGDVLVALDRTEARRPKSQFLGAIVVDEALTRRGTTVIRQLIDGQQRITSLQLLLAAAREVAKERRLPPRFATSFHRLTINDDEMLNELDADLKVWPTDKDRAAFRQVMRPDRKAVPNWGGESSTIVKAYQYFYDQVSKWTRSRPKAEVEKAYDELIQVINLSLYVIVVPVAENDNPQAIFETLNSRGQALQASDLVRNHLFYVAERDGVGDPESLYLEHWARFDDGYWREEVPVGNTMRPRMDALLRDFLTMETGREVPVGQLFVCFRQYLSDCGWPLSLVMARFGAYGHIFQALDTATVSDRYEQALLKRLHTLRIAAVRPILLQLFAHHSDAAVRRPALDAIESYVLRRMLVRLPSNDQGDVMRGLLKLLSQRGGPPGPTTVEYLASQPAKSNFWPSDEDLVKAVTTTQVYDKILSERVRLALQLINDRMGGRYTEPAKWATEDLSVEHLMPAAWHDHWPLEKASVTEREWLLHTLGNLTLVTPELNGMLGNEAWHLKRSEILKHSALNLNRTLPEVWDENAIRERGRAMAEVLRVALPRPKVNGSSLESPQVDTEDDDQVDEIDIVPEPPREGRLVRHVREVLLTKGGVLTPGQIARARSTAYPNGAGFIVGSIRERLKRGTITGVELTTDDKGNPAAKLVGLNAEPDRMPDRMEEATAILSVTVPSGASVLETKFNFEMVKLITRAKDELADDASEPLRQLRDIGGLALAKQVVADIEPTERFRWLVSHNRPDLTVEHLVLTDEYAPLFSARDLDRARERLSTSG